MKKLLKLFCLLVFVGLFRLNVLAASSSIKVNQSTIENGSSVKATVTLSGVAAWNIRIESSGATSGCSASYADATSNGKNATKSFTVTCKSTSTGLINISYSGDITSEDGNNKSVSGSKTVKVVAPREKSTNNNLSSLSVNGYDIVPGFSKDVLEYSVDVPNTINSIKISAKAEDSYAKVHGTGEVEVFEGSNKFDIVVTSETGDEKIYTLIVNVEDKEPIYVDVNNDKYSIVKNAKVLNMPELFTETTIDINGFNIPAFYNELSNTTLVGLKNEIGEVKLFVYSEGDYIEYKELKVSNLIVMLLENNKNINYFKKSTIIINDKEYECLKSSDKSDYALFYAMNMTNGKNEYYLYDTIEGTLQRYDDSIISSLSTSLLKSQKNEKILLGISLVILVFMVITLITFTIKTNKMKKLIVKKDNKKKNKE